MEKATKFISNQLPPNEASEMAALWVKSQKSVMLLTKIKKKAHPVSNILLMSWFTHHLPTYSQLPGPPKPSVLIEHPLLSFLFSNTMIERSAAEPTRGA